MRPRRKSPFSRALDVVPVFAVAGIGVAGVFAAMNILVTVPPPLINSSPAPSASVAPTLRDSPSDLPFITPIAIVTPAATASLPPFGPTIIHSAVSVADPNHAWTVYISYPSFLEGSTPWAPAMNADLRAEFEATAAQWEIGSAADRPAGAKINSLTSSFTTDLLSPALAAFTMVWADDSTPGQPQKTSIETLNFDLSTGQRIAFEDVFIDFTTALPLISSLSVPLLQDQLGADYDPALAVSGLSPSPTNFRNWTLTPDGLRVTFAEHQVTSRAGVTPSVVLPWATLRPVLVSTGPVAQLAGL
jgi:hypothetical protein